MRRLAEPPLETEFVTIEEYQKSTPASFALSDSPVLYSRTNGVVSGAVNGIATFWVATDGIHIWMQRDNSGLVLKYTEIILHALQSDPRALYVQFQDDAREQALTELVFVPENASELQAIFDSTTKCIELLPYISDEAEADEPGSDASEIGGSPDFDQNSGSESPIDLQTGQGDDEVWAPKLLRSEKKASASVKLHNGVLGKSKAPHDD